MLFRGKWTECKKRIVLTSQVNLYSMLMIVTNYGDVNEDTVSMLAAALQPNPSCVFGADANASIRE